MDLTRLAGHLSAAQVRSIAGAMTTPQIALWSGAVSSGKTISSLLAFLILLTRAPSHGLIVVVGRTLQTIERNLLDPLASPELFGPLAGQVHHTPGSTTAVILGRTVHLVGASDARAESRIRGSTIALAYVDEATLVPQSFWMMLVSRLRVPNAKLLATTNPDHPGHWLRQDFVLRAGEVGMKHWHFTLDDNPSLDPGYVALLKTQYTGLWYRRFILGHWIAGQGAVYDMWDPDEHVTPWDELPPMDRLLCLGVDHGTTNPTAALLLGITFDGRLYLVDEYRHEPRRDTQRLTDAQQSSRLREWMAQPHVPNGARLPVEYVAVDPAAASFRVQLHSDGLASSPANNDVSHGLSLVATLLARRQLLVSDRCAGWINEVGGYSWDEKATEKGLDAPLKVDDHSLDAGRYSLTTSEALWRPYLIDPLDLAA
ncbi:terminase family protein [Nocardiopsis eucommiae]|uniref:Terminase family protein n=1 Tax=Nocardiopsis eucommiae TaxID=2831970 RepID=A0A975QM46_9ACTN|nr:terminase family protein [Nocardiopsis eucommiae]